MKTLYTILLVYRNPYDEDSEELIFNSKKSSYSKEKLINELKEWIKLNPEKEIVNCVIGHEVNFKTEITIDIKEKV